MTLRKVLTWLGVALVVLYVVRSPDDAARVVRTAGDGLVVVASSLASFLGSLG